jgi:penicillin amidase
MFLSQSLQQALKTLTQQLGIQPEAWRWSNIHKADFIESGLGQNKFLGLILNSQIATPGSEYTVNYGHYNSQTMRQTHGAGYRQIIDLNNMNSSRYMIALGQSDNFFNKHRKDLLPLWRDGKYLPMSSLPKDWGKTARLVLEPKLK